MKYKLNQKREGKMLIIWKVLTKLVIGALALVVLSALLIVYCSFALGIWEGYGMTSFLWFILASLFALTGVLIALW